jgi:hypothetical protein
MHDHCTKLMNLWTKKLCMISIIKSLDVATLTLGLWPKQGLARGRDKRDTWEAHLILPGVQENVREWTLTLPRQLSLGELDFPRTPEPLGNDYRCQNPLVWIVLYIIEKILKRRCLKWAHHPFGHLRHKLWPKERPGIKLAFWLPTTKSQESTQFPCVQVA